MGDDGGEGEPNGRRGRGQKGEEEREKSMDLFFLLLRVYNNQRM